MSQHADENEDDQIDVAAVGEAETTPIEKQRLFLKLTVAASIYIYICTDESLPYIFAGPLAQRRVRSSELRSSLVVT